MFLLQDLSNYPTFDSKKGRLEFLSNKFDYAITLEAMQNLDLDDEQIAKLNQQEHILLYKDSPDTQDPNISIIPKSEIDGVAGEYQWEGSAVVEQG